ncbi:MAG TPA: AEC family transporter [Candidatus Kapabacteria bacterium]|nr:AEC family transporter [Candidatus Kapabacteria bacterium]
MLNFIIIVVSLILGILLRKSGRLPDSTPNILNRYVIWIALPAAILATVPTLDLDASHLIPATMPWFVFIVGFVIFWIASKPMGIEKRTLGALLLTGTLGNTSFVGFPMLRALIGEESLKTAIMIDQAGSFLVVSSLGLITANIFSRHETSIKEILRRIILFPPFIVLILALLLRSIEIGDGFTSVFRILSYSLGPAALIAVGYQLRFNKSLLRKKSKVLTLGLTYKLLIAPALVAWCYSLLAIDDQAWLVTSLESAMPPMITAAIIANEHGLDDELTSLMVGIGIPLSIFTVPLWYLVLG